MKTEITEQQFGCTLCKHTLANANLHWEVLTKYAEECKADRPPLVRCVCDNCGSEWRHYMKWAPNVWEAARNGERLFVAVIDETDTENDENPYGPGDTYKMHMWVHQFMQEDKDEN